MAFQRNVNWNTGDPITQERMNNIQRGIEEALDAAQTANQSSAISALQTDVDTLEEIVGDSESTGLRRRVTNLEGSLDSATQLGSWAAGQIHAATDQRASDVQFANLDTRFVSMANDTSRIEGIVNAHSDNLNSAIRVTVENDTLGKRFGDLERDALALSTGFTALRNDINAAGQGYNDENNQPSLVVRLNNYSDRIVAMETEIDAANGNSTLDDRFDAIELELNNAHESTALNKTGANAYGSIDARFEAIEAELVGTTDMSTRLDTLASDVSTLTTNKVNKTDVENNLLTADEVEKHVLDARQGRILKGLINDLDTAYKAADTSLSGRIDAIDNSSTGTVAGLASRVAALETEVDMTSTNSRIDEALLRLDDIDTPSTGSIAVLADRVTTAESDIDALEAIVNTTTTGLVDKVSALEDTVNDASTGLAATKAIADAAATASDLTTLAGRVTDLENEPKSATVIIGKTSITYDNEGTPTSIGETPTQDKDYLLQNPDDDQYYYWKYIGVSPNGTWKLISGGGAGGGGTSSAEFYADLTDIESGTESETIDYFIGTGSNYIHYRWRNNAWVQILPNHLINSVTVDNTPVTEEQDGPTKSRPIIKEIGSNTNLLAGFNAIQSLSYKQTENGTKLIWVDIDGDSDEVTITGGGGQGSGATASINRVGDANITTIAGETCTINYQYVARDSSGDLLATNGNATWFINRAQVATSTAIVNNPEADPQEYNTFNITPYLHNGENNITLSISIIVDEQTITRTKTWSITVVNFSLVWDYDESTIQDKATIDFSCIPYGIDITKTLHLKVGSYEQSQTVTTSGIPTTVELTNNFTHGNYTAEMWMTATINGASKTTPSIFHDFIVSEAGNTTPIIAATLPVTTVDEYNTISIPFVVYTPNANTSTVILAVDGTTVDTRDVSRITQTWHYTPVISDRENATETKVLTITTGSVTKTLNLTVNRIDINNNEIGGYTFKLKASDLPSNNALKAWYYDSSNQNATKLQFSNNFDWVNGGIQSEVDENGQLSQYIRVKSGTTMTIPYKMFLNDPRVNGMDFKIIFKIDNCRDYDATALTNMAEDIGIQLDAHRATFKSTTTEISTQYGEEEYTELEFEVYRAQINGAAAPDAYIMAWVDGVMTTARPYGGNFVQTAANAANLVIGSTDCDICIYLIKQYPFVLSRNDHITNFIADAPNAQEMIARYNRNDILDADEDIDYNKVAQKNPDCRVWLYDISRMTKAKDDSIDVYKFQQIWEGGDQYYQLTGTNAKLKIQGTSSVNYRYGAANTDIDFGKKKAPNATLVDGYGNNLLSDELEYKGFKINDNSLPITYSNTKVNFASCEQVNNMCNAEWYQRYQPFPSLSARDCMEFAMGVQFIKDRRENEPADGITLFTEKGASFDPEKYYMYSIANMGTSKKNTHIFHSDDELCIEIKENTTDAQKMKSFDSDWVLADHAGNYEIRYPDIKPAEFTQEIKDGWERFVTWMVASNPGAATGNALPESVTFEPYTFRGHNRTVTETEGRHFEQVLRDVTISQYAGTYDHDTFEYRMAKMLSECEDYMAMDSVVYHFCFIERHTMVDNVAKNTFWSSIKEVGGPNDEEGYWIWDLSKNYDNDTSDGNNNNGLLVFDYGNEAADTRDGTPVFNGHDAVWFVFVSNLYEACRAMFTNREAIGAWNSIAYHNYLLGEQQKVPERIWNECYWYDYLRTYENNVETTWINFLDGGQKTHQRKHYETYEEIYDSSKYRGSFSHNQSITLRGEAIDYQTLNLPAQESKFTITMFNKCYLTIWIGTNYQTVKCAKGVPVTLHFYKDNDPSKGYMSLANSVIDIDSGSMVQAIGDLSRIYPSSGQFGAAKRLRSLQIGSDTEGYYNPNMNTNSVLTFNNKMLEYLYVQNLPQATYNLDLSGCPELKFLKASGSGFTGFVFANGGLLNEAYINTPNSLVMRNLNNLTNANFHLTTPTAVTSLRLENCTLFDNYTFINSLTNLNVLRLTNINWSLDNNTLLDRLLGLMGIDESGYTIAQSYLAGNVELTGVVYGGDYNDYLAAWSPDLTIDVSHASQFIAQHLVTYKDEDGTVLYTKYINHGSNVVDIVAASEYSTPVKTDDISSHYTFGSLEYSQYIPYSGWRLSTDSQSIYDTYGSNPSVPVNGDISVFAVYTSTPKQYVVRWLVGNKVVSSTEPQNYGGGYNLSAPTIKDAHAAEAATCTFTDNGNGTCNYRIMTGWEKLPTNISPTNANAPYDINATWLERTNVNYVTALSSNDYSVAEKLLILKNIQVMRNDLALQDMFPVTLGYDGLKPAITLLASPKRYTGVADAPITTYTPFASNKSFTIAIDYRFEHMINDSANEAVLMSCYEEVGSSKQGFKLFYNPRSTNANPVPQISFGSTDSISDTNVYTIGSTIKNRGMVVLRHRASEPSILYVYSGANSTGMIVNYSANAFRKTLQGSANAANANIILGGINSSSSSSVNARGTIYSVKYWEEDLGEGECVQLANWCHETMNFAVQDTSNFDVHSALPIQNTSLVLHTLNASQMGIITDELIDQTTETTVGWDPSNIRTLYNGRLYQAFPIALQSIMTPVAIKHVKANRDTNGYTMSNNDSTTLDYIFAPSYRETGITGDLGNYSLESSGMFTWYGMRIMQYSNGSFIDQGATSKAYINLRFPYSTIAINSNTKVYVGYPSTNNSFEAYATTQSLGLRTGDILIPDDDSAAYIYISGNDVINGAPFVLNGPSYLTTSSGAWIQSTSWWTRSISTNGANGGYISGRNRTRLTSINEKGNARGDNYRENGIVYSIAL